MSNLEPEQVKQAESQIAPPEDLAHCPHREVGSRHVHIEKIPIGNSAIGNKPPGVNHQWRIVRVPPVQGCEGCDNGCDPADRNRQGEKNS